MRKLLALLALLASIGLLAGCNQTSHSAIRAHTSSVLRQRRQVWVEKGTAISLQAENSHLSSPQRRASTILSPWISNRGKLYQGTVYHQTNYATLKDALTGTLFDRLFIRQPSHKPHPHLLTVNQVNNSLKVLGAKSRLDDFDELVYLKDDNNQASVEPVGLLCEGNHLYVIQVSYYTLGRGAEINRGAVFIRKTQPASSLSKQGQ